MAQQRGLAVWLGYWRPFVSAMRALISLRTSVAGNGLSGWKWSDDLVWPYAWRSSASAPSVDPLNGK